MDRVTDGTSNRGEQHGHAKLTEEDVLAIYRSSARQETVARIYGIARQTVSDIRIGRRWKWLTNAA